MYTNIDINNSIDRITKFLSEIWDKYNCKVVEEAMNIVMQNTRMQFGDLIFCQTCGVAMGMLPAPTIANLYVAIYERDHIIPLIGSYLMYYKQFIDDGFTIWLHKNNPTTNVNNWDNFKNICNVMGLSWTFKSPPKKLIFMDMTMN
jgi:hypothetical protein